MIYFHYAPWVKQCCNWRNVCQTVFCFDRFGNVFQFDESWPHKWWSPFWVKISRHYGDLIRILSQPVFAFPTLVCQDTQTLLHLGFSALFQWRDPLRKLLLLQSRKLRPKFPIISPYMWLSISLSSPNSRMTCQSCLTPILKGSDSGQILSKQLNVLTTLCPGPPDHSPPEQTDIKKYMICKIGITSIGYMYLMENGILQKGMVITLSKQDTTAGMAPCTVPWKEHTKLRTQSTYRWNLQHLTGCHISAKIWAHYVCYASQSFLWFMYFWVADLFSLCPLGQAVL